MRFKPIGTKWIRCGGTHHKDRGRVGWCDDCGWLVVRVEREGKRPYLVDVTHSNYRAGYSCYANLHRCNPEAKATNEAARQDRLREGSIEPGQRVRVVKGRKVPVGTVGTVFWLGDGTYGPRVGIKTEAGERYFLSAGNVEADV